MNYAIQTLELEARLITKVLRETKAWDNFPEAFKDRQKKLREINNAIKLIQESKVITYINGNYEQIKKGENNETQMG